MLAETYTDLSAQLVESAEPINVIVVADTDLWDDGWWVQTTRFRGQRIAVPTADNGNFVLAAIENMTGSNDLISLRSRAQSTRPFTVVAELLSDAESRYLAEEERLKDELQETERRLARMERPTVSGLPDAEGGAGELFLTTEQEAEIARARAQIANTRAALREVQRTVRQDVDALESTLRFVNIGLMPALISALAVIFGLARRQRRKARSQGMAA